MILCCACYLGTGTLTVCVKGCGSTALNGRTVTVSQSGVTITTGTTSGSGCVTFTLPVGSYDVATDAPTHYDPASTSGVVVTPSTPATVNFTLAPSSGYSCSCVACYPGNCTGSAPYVVPPAFPATITGDDGIGSATMTQTNSNPLTYEVVVTRQAAQAYPDPYSYAAGCVLPGLSSNIDVPVRWRVYCISGSWYIEICCWDALITNPGGYSCTGVGSCAQAPYGAITTYFPAAAQSTCIQTALLAGSPYGNVALHTPSTGPLNGSATVSFQSISIGGTLRTMPYQVYGASTGFTWTA